MSSGGGTTAQAQAAATTAAQAQAAAAAEPKRRSEEEELSFREIMSKSAKSAVRGGTAGAAAMGANVLALMWMRTTVRSRSRSVFFLRTKRR